MSMFGDARLPERFWEKVMVTSDGCWVWVGCLNNKGYGQFRWRGKTMLSHRSAYEAIVGDPPDGLQCDHLCRNRACCNPAHLELVTNQENARRGEAGIKSGAQQRAKTHCRRGHEYSGDNLYVWSGKRSCRTCARDTMRKLRAARKDEAST